MRRITQESVKDPRQLLTLVTDLSREIESLQSTVRQLGGAARTVALMPSDMAMIRDALQAKGSHPINVTQLLGILAQSQRGYAVLATAAANLPSPVLYEIGTLGIVTTAPIALYYVSEGTPRTWTGPVSLPVTPHALLGPSHSDAATQSPTRGSLIKANSTPAWDEFVIGTAFQLLRVNAGATDLEYGSVVDGMLSSNVPLKNAANPFSGSNVFSVEQLFEALTGLTLGGNATNQHGAKAQFVWKDELLDVAGAATKDTTLGHLATNSLILAVMARVVTTVSGGGVTNYQTGDGTTVDRFYGASANLTAGSALWGYYHWRGNVASEAAGPTQLSTGNVRLTFDNAPTAGQIRVASLCLAFTTATS